MSPRSENIQPLSLDRRLHNAFYESAKNAVVHLLDTQDEDDVKKLAPFIEGLASHSVITLTTTQRYNQDMQSAGQNAMQRPFGIDLETLSPNIQLVLYPRMIYKPNDEDIKAATEEGYAVKIEGPQAMLYILDGFEKEAGNIEDMAANLYFITHMINSLLQAKYPLDTAERSEEFKTEIEQALHAVQDYTQKLPDEKKAKLSPKIAQITSFSQAKLKEDAKKIVLYHAEPVKAPGLYEPNNKTKITPEQAIIDRTLYLSIDDRDLPKREAETGTPSLPWVEYGTNKWDRNHQLFGRYQTPFGDETLCIDFKLDSTHMPAIYGFFDTLEITRVNNTGITEHILFSQEMGEKAELLFLQFFGAQLTPEQLQDSVVPIIIAGNFDFTDLETHQLLEQLVSDKGVKPEVGRVLADILRLSNENRLKRIQKEDDAL